MRSVVGLPGSTRERGKRQRQCPRCRRKWSYERRRQQWEILKASVLGSTAHHTARTLPISYPTVWGHYRSWRQRLWEQIEREGPPLCGEIEADESCFGGRRKGQRGRGAAGKARVFDMLERGGQVYSVVAPDSTKETLIAKIRDHSVKGSVYCTDEFGGHNDLKSHGKHLPVNHQVALQERPEPHQRHRGLLELRQGLAPPRRPPRSPSPPDRPAYAQPQTLTKSYPSFLLITKKSPSDQDGLCRLPLRLWATGKGITPPQCRVMRVPLNDLGSRWDRMSGFRHPVKARRPRFKVRPLFA